MDKHKELCLHVPATYRVTVQGALNEHWSNRLGGMNVTAIKQKDETFVTILYGRLPDQAALLGILTTLYDLHLPLLSVEYQSRESSGGGAS